MMNRKQRRAARINRETDFYHDYIRHLPEVPHSAPFEKGKVYHIVCHHDDWCTIYDGCDCNCNVIMTRHVEVRRS
jgi:hypothetical protein